jgi:ketosteroid isomerase-like protein
MSQENLELTRAGFEAFNRGDFDWLSRSHDPAIEWTTTAEDPDAATHSGPEAVRRYFEEWTGSFSGLHGELEECFDASEDRVFVTARFRGRGTSSGVDMDWRLSLVYTFRNGKMTRAVEYFDRAEALDAVGWSERNAQADS